MFTNLLNGLVWSGFFDRYHGYHTDFAGRGVRTFVDIMELRGVPRNYGYPPFWGQINKLSPEEMGMGRTSADR